MRIVVVGAGAVGFQLCKQLISEERNVVLIEKDPTTAKYASNHLDCLVINEEGNDLDVLKRAGVAKSDFFISVTDSDEVNMITCALVSSEFDVPHKIARVRNLDYSRTKLLEKPFLGIDHIVNPEEAAAIEIKNTIKYGAVSDVLLFEDSDIQLRNIHIDSKSYFNGKYLKDIKLLVREEFLIAGILRNDEFIIPSGDTEIFESDIVFLIATNVTFEKIFAKVGRPQKELKKILIIGGGRIGTFVTEYLIERNFNVSVVETDLDRCKYLSERFQDALVIHSDISDESVFEDEELHNYDAVVTTTNNDELNMLVAIYAKSYGIKRSVALTGKNKYLSIASNLGIDASISPRTSSVDDILKYIRGKHVKSVHSILDGRAEVNEYFVPSKCRIEGKALKDIKMPKNSLILSVTRENKSYIPGGNFIILEGDSVIAITNKLSVKKIEDLFS